MATDKQNKANRENALKSTGPKTTEGKAKSSKNAIKHGLCAQVHVEQFEQEEFQTRLEAWTGSLAPDGDPVKVDLVKLAVRCYGRVDRGLRSDDAEAARRVRHAESTWEKEQAELLVKNIGDLKTNAPVAVKCLEATVYGCDWMIKMWEGLLEAMEKQVWNPPYHDRAKQLLGYDEMDPKASVRVQDVWQELIHSYMEFWKKERTPIAFMPWHERVLTTEGLLKAQHRDVDLIWEMCERAKPVCESYKVVMREELARLKPLKERLIPLEQADREGAKERALVDGSEAGRLRLRYSGESQRDLFRALKEIREMRKDDAKFGPRVSRNEANSAGVEIVTNE